MSDKILEDEKQQDRKSGFDYVVEIFGWLQIVASLLLLGIIVGAIIYFTNPGNGRLALSILVALIGLIVGIIIATRVRKNKGTIHFVSRVMASPELDRLEEKETKENKKSSALNED